MRLVVATQHRVVEDIEAGGIPSPWYAVLHLLAAADDHRLPMSRIARDLSMTGGGFTKLADRMARDGLIDRRSAPGDRRIVHATLTDAGARLALRLEQSYLAGLRTHVTSVLTAEQLDSLRTLVGKLEPTVLPADVEVPADEPADRDPSLPDRRTSGN